MIKFIKIAPYELHPQERDEYEYLCAVASGTEDPPTIVPRVLTLSSNLLLHSTRRRAMECITKSEQLMLCPLRALDEITFDMEVLVPKKLWMKEGSVAVRRAFVRGFIENALQRPTRILLDEAREVLSIVNAAAAQGKTVVVLSHSFRLKVLEALIKSQGDLLGQPSLLREYLPEEKKTYPFLGGFSASVEEIERAVHT